MVPSHSSSLVTCSNEIHIKIPWKCVKVLWNEPHDNIHVIWNTYEKYIEFKLAYGHSHEMSRK